MNKKKLETIFWRLFAISVIVVFAFLVLTDDFEHVEDCNGIENTKIATITDSEIVEMEYGSKGMARSKSNLKIDGWQLGGVTFSSKKFSGVEPLLGIDYLIATGFYLNIYDYEIKEGNFRLYVIHEDEIIGILGPEDDTHLEVDNLEGKVTVVAVGESANFKFSMSHSEYDDYYHYAWEETE